MVTKTPIRWYVFFFLLALILSSCKSRPASPVPTLTQSPLESNSTLDAAGVETPSGAESTTQAEQDPALQQLVICLGQEPDSLFWYDPLSQAAHSVLAAVYDGPFDRIDYATLPVILEAVPSLAGGDMLLEPVSVEAGSRVADAQGNPVVLAEGVLYRPSGCTEMDCLQAYTGTAPVMMNQLVVRFRLKPGLVWSDGAPLTAVDSLFSYQAAQALQPSGWFDLLEATWSYQQLDDLTLEWRGLPGALGGSPADKFFLPLPRHAWESFGWVNLPDTQVVTHTPLGWGPYKIESWNQGDSISLTRNPNYFRAGEGLPVFDRLVYRFVSDPDAALQNLLSGACDLLDPTLVYETRLAEISAFQASGELNIHLQLATAWEQITLGIVPAATGQSSHFTQMEVREAAALCIDRQAIASQVLAGLAQPAQSLFPPGYPGAVESGSRLEFDPQAGQQRLEAAGWHDLDNEPATPRTSLAVPGFTDGAPLQVAYLVSSDSDRQIAAQLVQQGLQDCGFGVEISTLPYAEYLAPGPQGPVFGRNFDLAQFAWPLPPENPASLCALYLSGEIPGPYPEFPRGWGGGNASGYASSAYDQACQFLLAAPAEWQSYAPAVEQVQQLLESDVPVLPLYWRFRAALSRPEVCGLAQAGTTSSWLWNLEAFRRDPACP